MGEGGIIGTLEFQLHELGREALAQKGILGGGRAVVQLSSTGAHTGVDVSGLTQS